IVAAGTASFKADFFSSLLRMENRTLHALKPDRGTPRLSRTTGISVLPRKCDLKRDEIHQSLR
ncbi:hypothetical protein, partial [Paracoccus jeotgali]|uniref:hypothetical protein n=1 Tax=Paracoccus jeotgali TaxID=2065379 RepID=UPI0028B195F0